MLTVISNFSLEKYQKNPHGTTRFYVFKLSPTKIRADLNASMMTRKMKIHFFNSIENIWRVSRENDLMMWIEIEISDTNFKPLESIC